MKLRSTVVWFLFLLLAIMNGALRNAVLTPRLGEFWGHITSTILLSTAMLVVTWLTIEWIRPARSTEALLIGGGWALMTVAFEFLAGHYVFGSPWEAVGRLQSLRRSDLASGSRHLGVFSSHHGARAQLVIRVDLWRAGVSPD